MTIAIGVLASDGLVVAADTQESTGDYMKGLKGQMACFYAHDEHGWVESCIVAGAGDSGYVQSLIKKLGETFRSTDTGIPIYNLTNLPSQNGNTRIQLKNRGLALRLPTEPFPCNSST